MSTHNQARKEESHHEEPMGDRSQEQSENVIVSDAEEAGENTEGRDDETDEQSENSVEVPDGEEPGENPEGADGPEDNLVLENVWQRWPNCTTKWLKITNHDCIGLRKFSDFLMQCLQARNITNPGLRVLDDDRENPKLVSKGLYCCKLVWGKVIPTSCSIRRIPPERSGDGQWSSAGTPQAAKHENGNPGVGRSDQRQKTIVSETQS